MEKIEPWHRMARFCAVFRQSAPDCPSDGVRTNAGFAACERVALAVDHLVLLVMLLAEGTEVFLAFPAVDGEVRVGNVSVAQQLSAEIVWRRAEELRPGTVGTVSGFKRGYFVFSNLKLPDNNEHELPSLFLMVAYGTVQPSHHTQPASMM